MKPNLIEIIESVSIHLFVDSSYFNFLFLFLSGYQMQTPKDLKEGKSQSRRDREAYSLSDSSETFDVCIYVFYSYYAFLLLLLFILFFSFFLYHYHHYLLLFFISFTSGCAQEIWVLQTLFADFRSSAFEEKRSEA